MKTKKIINYKNLSRELKRLFLKLYGNDYESSITEFKDPRDSRVHRAVTLETEDSLYLVIVDNALKKKPEIFNLEEDTLTNDGNEEGEDLPLYFA